MYVKRAGPKKAWISIGRGADFGAHLYPGCKVRLLVAKFVFWLQSAPIAGGGAARETYLYIYIYIFIYVYIHVTGGPASGTS